MTDQFHVVDCPSCGAPLTIPQERKRLFQCEFCGTTLQDRTSREERSAGQRPQVTIHSTSVSPELSGRSTGASLNLGCLLLGLVLLGGAIYLVTSGALESVSEQLDPLRVYNFGLARQLPTDNDTQPDVVGVTYNSDETRRMVYVDFDADPHLRWQSDPLGEDAGYTFNPVVASRSSVYIAHETTLTALDRQDGTIAWQTTLSDKVSNTCQSCLQIFGDKIVALTTDGVLNGVDAGTGEQAWRVRLTATPRQLLNLSGKAGVLDEQEDVVGINVYEPADGTLAQRIVPQCPNEIFPNRPQTLGIYDPLLISGDGKNLYVPIGHYDPGCVQNWDTATLTQVWQATMPREIIQSLDREPYLLTQEMLYASDGHNLYTVSLTDGTHRQVFSDQDHNIIPYAAQDDILVALAERTRGTRRHTLWGLDVETGDQLWEFDPTAEDIYEDSSDVVYDEGLWSAGITLDKVVVLEAFSDPSSITFTILKLADGTQVGVNTLDYGEDSSSYWIQVLGWGRDQVYLAIDEQLRAVDFTSATEISSWP